MNSANRVAINTIVQYIQLVMNVLIGLFTVRIILNSLGAADYGIYNLIGGIITLIAFIRDSLSQTSIRFISVSIGSGIKENIRKTFKQCSYVHFIMAISLSILLEIIGFFLFDGFLNIPDDRISSAKIVFHCMVVSLFLNVMETPILAMIVAHEKFIFTSFVGILVSFFKLLVAIAVSATYLDKLSLYGFLMAGIVLAEFVIYFVFCWFNYHDLLSFGRVFFRETKGVFSFAGWTMMDVLSSILDRQGYAVMLNKFFGPVTNAVYALAGQVEGHLYSISASAIGAMKPQVMKSFGSGDVNRTLRLSLTAGKFGFSLMSLISIPLLVMMPEVLNLWLKEIPDGTVLFARLMVVACMCEQLTRGLVHANQALGRIKWFSIVVSSVRVSALPISIIALLFGAEAYVTIVIFLICEVFGSMSRVIVMSKISDLKIMVFVKSVFLQILPPFFISLFVCMVIYHFFNGVFAMVVVSMITIFADSVVVYFVGLTKEEKLIINNMLVHVTEKISRPR